MKLGSSTATSCYKIVVEARAKSTGSGTHGLMRFKVICVFGGIGKRISGSARSVHTTLNRKTRVAYSAAAGVPGTPLAGHNIPRDWYERGFKRSRRPHAYSLISQLKHVIIVDPTASGGIRPLCAAAVYLTGSERRFTHPPLSLLLAILVPKRALPPTRVLGAADNGNSALHEGYIIAGEPSESRWSPPSMDTRDLREVTSASLAS
ncbi:hypothetical protein EVAR_102150_1 [Eumeta japonica]|uniref:Uncharacterized protein n=1 Tax=Eumeta variegata TaxID=151549 RepID=A0A4C1TZT1_EUMVA|nr:hypothetical protein EVAR_102150_1 [Eumeta japonica]